MQVQIVNYLYIVASLCNVYTFPIITGKLRLLASTHEEDLCACLSLVTGIVLYLPCMSSYWQGISVQHCQGQLRIVCVIHLPHLVEGIS